MVDIIAYAILGIAGLAILMPIFLGVYIIWKMPK